MDGRSGDHGHGHSHAQVAVPLAASAGVAAFESLSRLAGGVRALRNPGWALAAALVGVAAVDLHLDPAGVDDRDSHGETMHHRGQGSR